MSKRDKVIMIVGLAIAGVALVFLTVFIILILTRDDNPKGNADNIITPEQLEELQRGQRDDARKRDVAAVAVAVITFASNNNSTNLMTGGADYYTGVIWDQSNSEVSTSKFYPYIDTLSDKVDYVYAYGEVSDAEVATLNGMFLLTVADGNATGPTKIPSLNNIVIYQKASCNSGNVLQSSVSGRSAAVVVQIEAGGDNQFFCQDFN